MSSFRLATLVRPVGPAMIALLLAWTCGSADVGRADEAGFESLFDGTTLTGWKASEHVESWKVVDGAIICFGPRSHLFYVGPD